MMAIEIKVGSKGELFLPKKVRSDLNLNPGDRLFVELEKDKLIIRKIQDLFELLDQPKLTSSATPEEIEDDLNQIQNEQIDETSQD